MINVIGMPWLILCTAFVLIVVFDLNRRVSLTWLGFLLRFLLSKIALTKYLTRDLSMPQSTLAIMKSSTRLSGKVKQQQLEKADNPFSYLT